MPNRALREVSGIRPHLVLETSHTCKNVFESKEGEKRLGLGEEVILV